MPGNGLRHQQFRAFRTPDHDTFQGRCLLDRIIHLAIAIVVDVIRTPERFIGKKIPVYLPAIKRIQVQLDRGHDRIGIPKINHVGDPLGDFQLRLVPSRHTAAGQVLVVKIPIPVSINPPVPVLEQHRHHEQVTGELVAGQGVCMVVVGPPVVVMVKGPTGP